MRIKISFICFLLVSQFCAQAQNWQSVGSPLTWQIRYLYNDTANDVLVASGAVGSYLRFLQYTNTSDWDTLGNPIGGVPFQATHYQGNYYGGTYFSTSPNQTAVGKLVNNIWQPFADINGGAYGFYQDDSDMYVLGGFDSIDGIQANGVALFDGIGWSNVGTATFNGGSAVTCAIFYQGDLYIGGGFHDTVGNCLAKWNGQQWTGFGSFFSGGFDAVNCLAEYNGELYVGGYFTTASGSPGNMIARWDGSTWTQVGGGITGGQVLAMKVYDNCLWVGGQFTMAGGVSTPYLAKYDGTDWCNVGVFDNGIAALEIYNGELYAGGGFWSIDGDSTAYVAKWIGGSNTGACGHLTTGIEETQNGFFVSVFPNPASTSVTFQMTGESATRTVMLIDNLGREIWRKETTENTVEYFIDGTAPGLYYYRIEEQGALKFTGKLVIE